ncbi:GNAT family N-acetyltransferase [Evansella cellulosilytica]|uniref:GCN5-related N-acetyltransferase n=1 Tax=Evansella cellulosilytica (strain ATCC 21833 / DSM 2522 / FERM P-1141 / JCM 9156 / N-4) TaxID=649639 RepID=E6TSM3_EVAC2|nr:GCN5-related N-acetyltransferase [Evansella cellulosilytica DSM 2522]
MNFFIENLDDKMAKQILSWKYEKPYDFYNNEVSEEALNELLDGSYKAITTDNGDLVGPTEKVKERHFFSALDLIGFFCIGQTAQIPIGHQYGVYREDCVDIGLGMHPDYVGKGYGFDFCTYIIKNINENFEGMALRLSVATFNKRAIHLYEKLGFVKKDKFNTPRAEFMTMMMDR